MIQFHEIDSRLDRLGRSRAWLAEVTQRSPGSLRAALAPNAAPKNRTLLLQKALSDVIEAEEARQKAAAEEASGPARSTPPRAVLPPGYHSIFLTDEELDRAERASRLVQAPSLAVFCHDVIQAAAEEILAREAGGAPVSGASAMGAAAAAGVAATQSPVTAASLAAAAFRQGASSGAGAAIPGAGMIDLEAFVRLLAAQISANGQVLADAGVASGSVPGTLTAASAITPGNAAAAGEIPTASAPAAAPTNPARPVNVTPISSYRYPEADELRRAVVREGDQELSGSADLSASRATLQEGESVYEKGKPAAAISGQLSAASVAAEASPEESVTGDLLPGVTAQPAAFSPSATADPDGFDDTGADEILDFPEIEIYGGIAAGQPIDSDGSSTRVRVRRHYPAGHYGLQVFGKSMEPTIPDGSVIIVRENKDRTFPRKGSIVVYHDAHGASLKEYNTRKAQPGEEDHARLGKVAILLSHNPSVPEVKIQEGSEIQAIFVEVAK